MEKVSLTLDESLLVEARKLVGHRGLSQYLNRALRYQLQRDRLVGLLGELENEVGPIETQVMQEVRRAWPDPNGRGSKRRGG